MINFAMLSGERGLLGAENKQCWHHVMGGTFRLVAMHACERVSPHLMIITLCLRKEYIPSKCSCRAMNPLFTESEVVSTTFLDDSFQTTVHQLSLDAIY